MEIAAPGGQGSGVIGNFRTISGISVAAEQAKQDASC